MLRRFFVAGAAGAALLFSIQRARGAVFAQYVPGSYTQGTFSSSYELQFNNPLIVNPTLDAPNAQTAGGNPAGLTGQPGFTEFAFPSIVSPFSPPYDTDQLVTLGIGGSITLHFPQTINVTAAPTIGVFTGAGLFDTSSDGSGLADSSGDAFVSYQAIVNVSKDGATWKSLGLLTFGNPENYYNNAVTPYDDSAPANPSVADYGKPFTGTDLSFANENFQQIITTLNGSAGGNWLDLSASGLSQVNYIQFTEPNGQVPDGTLLALQAVTVSENLPEPACAAGLLVCAGLLARRRKGAKRSRRRPA